MLVVFHVFGAVALLLFGIKTVQEAIHRLLGNKLERYLRKLTKSKYSSFGVGAVSSFTLQSSTAVVLMVASFTNAGFLSLVSAVSVVLGAELGSSVAGLALSLDVQFFALPMILVGFVMQNRKGKKITRSGKLILGLGLILLGLNLIGHATGQVSSGGILYTLMEQIQSDPYLTVFIMLFFTVIVHSSLASVLIIAQFVQQDIVTVTTGLYLVLGANLGGAFPALISAWPQGGKARYVVGSNLVFKIFIVVFGFGVVQYFSGILGEVYRGAFGIVGFHFSLNLICGILLLFLVKHYVNLTGSVVAKPEYEGGLTSSSTIYLSYQDIDNPSRVIANASNEALHMADVIYLMMSNSYDAFNDPRLIADVRSLDDKADTIHRESLNYLVSASIDSENRLMKHQVVNYITNLEHIGDIVESSLMQLAKNKDNLNIVFNIEEDSIIERLHSELIDVFRLSQAVFTSGDPSLANELIELKRAYKKEVIQLRDSHIGSLTGHVSENIYETQLFLDILRDFQRICSHLAVVAYPVLDSSD